MDDLTRERYPHGVPWAERYAVPTRLAPKPGRVKRPAPVRDVLEIRRLAA